MTARAKPAATDAEPPPTVEPGNETSEWFAVKVFSIVTHAGLVLFVGAATASLIHPTPELMVFAGLVVETINGAVVSVYALGRSIRKRGTQA